MKKWGEHNGELPILNHLIALEATARLGSFRAAADEMYLTQGAVAQQIRALEKQLGCKLFDRQARGLVPNSIGQEYVNRMGLALGIIEAATKEVTQSQKSQDSNQVKLSTTPSFASRWLIPLLPALNQLHPEISLMIDASEKVRTFQGENSIDMSIRWGNPPFIDCHSHFLHSGKLIPVCAPKLLTKKSKLSPAEVIKFPLISDSHDNWKYWIKAYSKDLKINNEGLIFSQSSHALEATEQGMGLALVPELLVINALKAGTLVTPMDDKFQLENKSDFYIVTADKPAPNTARSKIIEWLLNEANVKNQ